MEIFDKRMALYEIEDALTNVDTPHGRGMATGLCSAFYMCGLLSVSEWEAFMDRIPADAYDIWSGETCEARRSEAKLHDPRLN